MNSIDLVTPARESQWESIGDPAWITSRRHKVHTAFASRLIDHVSDLGTLHEGVKVRAGCDDVFSGFENLADVIGVPGQGTVDDAVGVTLQDSLNVPLGDDAGFLRADDGSGIEPFFFFAVDLDAHEIELRVPEDASDGRLSHHARGPLKDLVLPHGRCPPDCESAVWHNSAGITGSERPCRSRPAAHFFIRAVPVESDR